MRSHLYVLMLFNAGRAVCTTMALSHCPHNVSSVFRRNSLSYSRLRLVSNESWAYSRPWQPDLVTPLSAAGDSATSGGVSMQIHA